ncbi:MAG: HEAT repeat domain-containing protein [Gemmatimonadota bacterium]|nr:MAG: HEAT repeat domain-containing protein [Gemmatimonadota bacterium]
MNMKQALTTMVLSALLISTSAITASGQVGIGTASDVQALDVKASTNVPVAWADQDPADSLYRSARRELNAGRYERAAGIFEQIRSSYRDSEYTPDSYYWEAFARYRTGDTRELETALDLLDAQARRYPNAVTRDDARSLSVMIRGKLAERGNAGAAQNITEQATQEGCPEEEDDVRVMALNALLNMDSDRALPILEQVLQRRDACSVELRRKAVWLISQKESDETAAILLDVVRSDPDREVREQAVFWLSQVDSDEAVVALDSLLMESDDRAVQEKAIFALSQHDSPRSAEILRRYVMRDDVPEELRENAIFWLGQSHSRENQQFLRDLYAQVESEALKDKIIFSISQQSGAEAGDWLVAVAMDQNETVERRKSALFWAGQRHQMPTASLGELYRTMDDREMREQVIFVLSQRDETEAVDVLMNIARNETDRELRKNAIFWLGQSDDPRVPDFLLELINIP